MTTIPTATSMKLKFPEFADVSDTTIEFAIEEAAMAFPEENCWTSGGDFALMYYAAHIIASGQVAANSFSGGSGGEIASESIGRLSISYKTNTASNSEATFDNLASSSYGRRYIEMRGMNFGGPVVI